MNVNFPFSISDSLGIDGHDNTLASKTSRSLRNQRWIFHRSRIDRHLITALRKKFSDFFQRPDPAANGKRNEEGLGNRVSQLDPCKTGLRRGGDIEKNQLIGSLFLIALGRFDRIPSIFEF